MLSSMIVKGVQDRAQRVIVYGPEGVGKSTLASELPAPIFLDTEDGTSHLDVPRVVCQSMGDVLDAVRALLKEEHGYRSVVIDTIDWCESMMVAAVVAEANNPKIKNIEDFGYGKGYTVLAKYAQDFLGVLNSLVARGLHVVLLAHSRRVKVELPDSVGSYDKYELKLTKQVAPLVKEWSDALLFLNFVTIIQDGKGHGGSLRRIYLSPQAPFEAKNRHGLPEFMDCAGDALRLILGGAVAAERAGVKQKLVASGGEPVDVSFLSGAVSLVETEPVDVSLSPQHRHVMELWGDRVELIVAFAKRIGKVASYGVFSDVPVELLLRIMNNPDRAFEMMNRGIEGETR